LAEKPGSVLVVPIGSIEQHGHHLPVSTDTLLVDAVATAGGEAVADEVPVLLTPPIYPGFSPHHISFGGTLTLGFEPMLKLVEDTVKSALDNGFDVVLLLNGHGGNVPLIGAATSTIGVENPEASIYGLTYVHFAEPFIDEIRDSDPGGMGHGGEFETSLMLHLRPELVNESAMEGTYIDDSNQHTGDDMFEGGSLSVYRPFTAYSDSGAIGDPELASADKGEQILYGLRAELAAVLEIVHKENT
jgi:creatinine amidohydrolase